MSKIYIEGNGWGLTLGRLAQMHGEPVGIYFWSIVGSKPREWSYAIKNSGAGHAA